MPAHENLLLHYRSAHFMEGKFYSLLLFPSLINGGIHYLNADQSY